MYFTEFLSSKNWDITKTHWWSLFIWSPNFLISCVPLYKGSVPGSISDMISIIGQEWTFLFCCMPIGLIDAPIVRHAQIQCLGLGTASEKNGMVLSPFQEITMFSNHLFNQNRKTVSFQAKKKRTLKSS